MKTYLCKKLRIVQKYFKKMVSAPTISEVIEKQKMLLKKEVEECDKYIEIAEFTRYVAMKRYTALELWEKRNEHE